jgi:hypothetical protein
MMMLSSMVHSFTVPLSRAAFLQTSNKGNVRRQALMLFQQPFSDDKSTTNVLPSTSFQTTLTLHIPTLEEMEEMGVLLSVLASPPDAIFLGRRSWSWQDEYFSRLYSVQDGSISFGYARHISHLPSYQ